MTNMISKMIVCSLPSRSLTLSIGLACFSLISWGQITLVHVTSCGPQTFPTATCTIPATGTGNMLVVAWTSGSGGGGTVIAGVADNVGNMYLEAGNARSTDSSANSAADIWYAGSSLPRATTVTITPSPSGSSGTVVIWEFSGAEPFSPLDQTAVLNSQPASTTPLGASVTPSPAEVVVSVANVAGTATGMKSGNAFTSDSVAGGDGFAHLITSSAGTYTPQWKTSSSGTFSSSTVSFKAANTGGGACDLNQDGVVNVVDVQLAVNMDLTLIPCPGALNGGDCGSTLVTQILNAALGQACSVTLDHSVSLTWTASSSGNIAGYNVFRSTTSGTGFVQINGSLVTTTSYVDSNVTAGQTYYYVTTAVDTSNNQSSYSNQTEAAVPTT